MDLEPVPSHRITIGRMAMPGNGWRIAMSVSMHSDARGEHMARAVATTAEAVARLSPHATRLKENHVLPSTSPFRVSLISAWIT